MSTQLTNTVLAVEGDTWGIAGPTFLKILLLLAGAALLTALVGRRAIRNQPGRQPSAGWDRDPYAVALLNQGPGLAVTAALSALHVEGLVTATKKAVTRVGDPDTSRRPALERAILDSTSVPTSRPTLAGRAAVRTVLESIRADLVARGLLLDDNARRRMRRSAYPMLAVLALGFTRLVAGAAGGRAVGYLALLLVAVAGAVVWLFVKVPVRSALGDRELARLRREHQHLSPGMRPDWVAGGALAAGMGVAVFGASAVWASDPAFAGEVVARVASGGSGSSYASCGGYSCGGGSSGGGCGGGGGGCGGGGCGG